MFQVRGANSDCLLGRHPSEIRVRQLLLRPALTCRRQLRDELLGEFAQRLHSRSLILRCSLRPQLAWCRRALWELATANDSAHVGHPQQKSLKEAGANAHASAGIELAEHDPVHRADMLDDFGCRPLTFSPRQHPRIRRNTCGVRTESIGGRAMFTHEI